MRGEPVGHRRRMGSRTLLVVTGLLAGVLPFVAGAPPAHADSMSLRPVCSDDFLEFAYLDLVVEGTGPLEEASATVDGSPAELVFFEEPAGPGTVEAGIGVWQPRTGDMLFRVSYTVAGTPVVLEELLAAEDPCPQYPQPDLHTSVTCVDDRTQVLHVELDVGEYTPEVVVEGIRLEGVVERTLPPDMRYEPAPPPGLHTLDIELPRRARGDVILSVEFSLPSQGSGLWGIGVFFTLPGCGEPRPPNPDERYLAPVFSDVTVTPGLHYRTATGADGRSVDLELDLYEPAGDTAGKRPLLIWMHGGGFAFGERDGYLEQQVAESFARRGYVVASVEYRLDPDNGYGVWTTIEEALAMPRFVQSILDAAEDARAAVAWLRAHAAEHRIDPEVILSSGYSAGAVTSLNLAYMPVQPVTPEDPEWASRIQGAWSLAGTTLPGFIEPGEPPVVMVHGTEDTEVAYGHAAQICPAARAVGNVCELHSYPGVGHWLPEPAEDTFDVVSRFFYDEVLVAHGYGPPEEPAPEEPVPEEPAPEEPAPEEPAPEEPVIREPVPRPGTREDPGLPHDGSPARPVPAPAARPVAARPTFTG